MDIVHACCRFSFLGVHLSEQWLSELFQSMEDQSETSFFSQKITNFDNEFYKGLTIKQCLSMIRAKSYFDSKEFNRAFGILNDDISLNKIASAVFLKNYSLLLSLEKQNNKTDQLHKMVIPPSDSSILSLKYSKIEMEISSFLTEHSSENSNNNQFIGLLEWLLSVSIYRQNRFLEALEFQIRSLCDEPYNWSCWIDLIRNITSNGHGNNTSKNIIPDECNLQEDSITDSFSENQNKNFGLQPFKKKQNLEYFKHFKDASYGEFTKSLGVPECVCAQLSYALYLGLTGRWKEALNEYTSVSKVMPKSSYIRYQIAKCNHELGNDATALEIHQSIIKRDKYYMSNAVDIATILSEKNNVKELSLLAKKCVELSKYSIETCIVVGMYHWLTNDKHKALRFYKRALLFDTKSSTTWVLCGFALHELGNIRSSLFAYRTAVNLDNTNVTALYGIAQIYSRMNLHSYSIKLYEKALIQAPNDSFLWYNLGISLEKMGNYQEASRSFYKALSCESNKKTNSDSEIKYMGKLLKLESDQWNQIGTLYWAKKIIQRAIDYGYLEKIDEKSDNEMGLKDNSNMNHINGETHNEVLSNKKQDIFSLSYQEENSLFSNWEKLRWSVKMIPQKLPVDIIVALECLLQMQSVSNCEKRVTQHELTLENLRELLNIPKSLQVLRDL